MCPPVFSLWPESTADEHRPVLFLPNRSGVETQRPRDRQRTPLPGFPVSYFVRQNAREVPVNLSGKRFPAQKIFFSPKAACIPWPALPPPDQRANHPKAKTASSHDSVLIRIFFHVGTPSTRSHLKKTTPCAAVTVTPNQGLKNAHLLFNPSPGANEPG